MIGDSLTVRETAVLQMLANGQGTADIAKHFGVSQATISQTKQRIRDKGVPVPWGSTGGDVDRDRRLADLKALRDAVDNIISRLEGQWLQKDAAE